MSKFAMYIINQETGDVFGTNDTEEVVKYSEADDVDPVSLLILHSTNGDVQRYGEEAQSIEPLSSVLEGEEDDPEDSDDSDDVAPDGESTGEGVGEA